MEVHGMSSPTVIENLTLVLQNQLRYGRERGEAPKFGDDFRFLIFALGHFAVASAQLSQDLWVLFETGSKRNGFFVEFGAGDGVLLSNTYLLEHAYGWTGVLAEPNPAFHDALARNRKCTVSMKCIGGQSGDQVVFNKTKDPHLSAIDSYSSEDLHAAKRADGMRVSMETQSLEGLLRDARAPSIIDYLSVDTEGSEFDILSGFDFRNYDVRLITVEHNYTPRRQEIYNLLVRNGFRRRFEHLSDFDDWYVKA
jgi:FkbM family methyltransferase